MTREGWLKCSRWKINLKNIRWIMPRCIPSDVAKHELVKQIKCEDIFDIGVWMHQCVTTSVPKTNHFTWRLGLRASQEVLRFIFLTFQKNKDNNQQKNSATFDTCELTSAHVLLNNGRYRQNYVEVDYTTNFFDHMYHDFAGFVSKSYGVDQLLISSAVDPILY